MTANFKFEMKSRLQNFLEGLNREKYVLVKKSLSSTVLGKEFPFYHIIEKKTFKQLTIQLDASFPMIHGYSVSSVYKPSRKMGSGQQIFNTFELSEEILEKAFDDMTFKYNYNHTNLAEALKIVSKNGGYREKNIIENMANIELKDMTFPADNKHNSPYKILECLANVYDNEGNGMQIVIQPFNNYKIGDITN